MDPWLEAPWRWPGFHDTLVIKSVEVLQPQLRKRGYYANPNERVWVGESTREIVPNVPKSQRKRPESAATSVIEFTEPVKVLRVDGEFHEGIVEIFEAATHRLITCIEFLSPSNKSPGEGRELYLRKRGELKSGRVHLIEVDLLRRGLHTVDVPLEIAEAMQPWTYLINTVRSDASDFEFYPVSLRHPLPKIRLPLKTGDEDLPFDLQEVFTRSYEITPYPDNIDYSKPPRHAAVRRRRRLGKRDPETARLAVTGAGRQSKRGLACLDRARPVDDR
jgi:hypothetical protein